MIEVLQKLIFVFKNYIHTLIHYSIVGSGIIVPLYSKGKHIHLIIVHCMCSI